MTSRLVDPVSGESTFSRFDRRSSRPSTSTTTASGLTDHLAGLLVRAQPPPRRVAEVVVVRPLGVLDLAHEHGLDEVRARRLHSRERRREGRLVLLDRPKVDEELVAQLVGEPRPDATCVLEAVRSWDPAEQGAEGALELALAVRPPADDDLLGSDVLHLDPLAAALPGRVGRVTPLGDHAL